ncbi:MAG TPA: hypothetical protein PKA80_08815 [Ignavibacteriaceae bacterium]|nr:hypothetical protein [Ignavibacteriaceae bacterium]
MDKKKAKQLKIGSTCPKAFLMSDKQFTDKPICTASIEFLIKKFNTISELNISDYEKDELKMKTSEKVCLGEHLGNSVLLALGIQKRG